MFTKFDKALTGFFAPIVGPVIVNWFWGIDIGAVLSRWETFAVALFTGALTYFIPNKKA